MVGGLDGHAPTSSVPGSEDDRFLCGPHDQETIVRGRDECVAAGTEYSDEVAGRGLEELVDPLQSGEFRTGLHHPGQAPFLPPQSVDHTEVLQRCVDLNHQPVWAIALVVKILADRCDHCGPV